MNRARKWIVGLALAGVGLCLLVAPGGRAGEGTPIGKAIDKIAELPRKGDAAGAKKEAEAVAKKLEEIHEAMDMFKPRKKDGIGVGDKPGAIVPDGIEQMLLKIGATPPARARSRRTATPSRKWPSRAAAIAEISIAKPPDKDMGKKTKKDWVAWSIDMRDSALQLAKAAKARARRTSRAPRPR